MPKTSSRMLALLSLLQSRRDWPGAVLAERLEVTPRTVRRDVDRLRELGYSITAVKGPDGGYRLAAGSELPPLLFDDEQAVAIAVALQSVPSTGVDLDVAAARALTTVRQVMPSRLRHRIDGIRFTDSGAPTRVDPKVLETVSTLTREQRMIRFDYAVDQSDVAASDRTPRRVEPHAVAARGGFWYLIGWDLQKEDWRIFRLDRLNLKVPAAGAPFTRRPIPTGDAQTYLAARFKGAEETDVWPLHGEFRLELPLAAVAPWIGDGDVERIDDGACYVRIGSWSWTGAMAWILRFDAPFTVLGPAELVHAIPALAARVAGSVADC